MPRKMNWFEQTFKTSKRINYVNGSHYWVCYGVYNNIEYLFSNSTEAYVRREAEQYFRKKGVLV